MLETIYVFKIDKTCRLQLPVMVRKIYSFEKTVYMKLLEIEGEKYLQISGTELELYQSYVQLDAKGRFFVPKEVKEKFCIGAGDKLDSYEGERENGTRTLLLKKQLVRK